MSWNRIVTDAVAYGHDRHTTSTGAARCTRISRDYVKSVTRPMTPSANIISGHMYDMARPRGNCAVGLYASTYMIAQLGLQLTSLMPSMQSSTVSVWYSLVSVLHSSPDITQPDISAAPIHGHDTAVERLLW